MSAAPLTIADFAPRLGKPVAVETQQGPLRLVLTQAQELPSSVRDGGAFRLEFNGPADPQLVQGTYRFQLDRGPADIFIVPLARTPEMMRYEAIFY